MFVVGEQMGEAGKTVVPVPVVGGRGGGCGL